MNPEGLKTTLNKQNAAGGPALAMESEGVPCLRLPFNGRPGMTIVLGVIESPDADWGLGLLPPLVVPGSASPSQPLPGRNDIERELCGILRSVALPNAKSTSDLWSMISNRDTPWEEFERLPLPALWEEYDGDRHRHSG